MNHEINPQENVCVAGLGCPGIYVLEDITNKDSRCDAGLECPSTYSIKDITPPNSRCIAGACPAIYEQNKMNYLIVGRLMDPQEVGLEKRVGKGEVLISIPKNLIDDRKI